MPRFMGRGAIWRPPTPPSATSFRRSSLISSARFPATAAILSATSTLADIAVAGRSPTSGTPRRACLGTCFLRGLGLSFAPANAADRDSRSASAPATACSRDSIARIDSAAACCACSTSAWSRVSVRSISPSPVARSSSAASRSAIRFSTPSIAAARFWTSTREPPAPTRSVRDPRSPSCSARRASGLALSILDLGQLRGEGCLALAELPLALFQEALALRGQL